MAIYLISDLHLQHNRPAITQGFLSYLTHFPSDAKALYILGDFFEYWIGDDYCDPLITTIQEALLALSQRGVEVFFQHGNRDFLVGDEFANACGMTLLPEEYILEAENAQYLLMHGDSLCIDDTEYMAFRAQSRSPEWQAMILGMSIEERLALAQQMRDTSQSETAQKDEYITDVNQSEVEARMTANNVQHLIHGHTHRPKPHQFSLNDQAATRTVLGDWSDTHGWQIRLGDGGIELSLFNFSRLGE